MAQTARETVMDLLARRDHSEKELRDKLSRKFEPEQVDEAIAVARAQGWLAADEVLVERVSEELRRRKKGALAINEKLKSLGLPEVKATFDDEVEKALALAEAKFARERADEGPLEDKLRERVGRFLMSKGFEEDVVRKVIYEKL